MGGIAGVRAPRDDSAGRGGEGEALGSDELEEIRCARPGGGSAVDVAAANFCSSVWSCCGGLEDIQRLVTQRTYVVKRPDEVVQIFVVESDFACTTVSR